DHWHTETIKLSPEDQKKAAEHLIRNFVSKTIYATPVVSGVAGYIDRDPRTPYGRATPYTEKHGNTFKLCFPFLRKLDAIFKRELPNRWRKQRQAADKIDPRFLIASTVFSTLTINHNWRTAAHRDAGDLGGGFSSIAAFTGPDGKGWRGGEFIL